MYNDDKMTQAWLDNANNCFKSMCGLDITTLEPEVKEQFARAWAYYFERGHDAGTSAILVCERLDKDT